MATPANQAEVQNQLRTLATGMGSLQIPDPIILDTKSYTKAQIAQVLNGAISATDAATAAKAAAKVAVATAATQRAQAIELRSLLHLLIEVQLGKTSPVLAQLGFAPPPTTRTVAEKSAAADKAKATRTARHTMGKKQRAAITGSTVAAAVSAAVPVAAGAPAATPTITPVTAGTAVK
jgi:hypothetical protein